jgi:uncharacterized protein
MNLLPLDFTILFPVIFASIVQSIFGVGVLLFGTPILLLLGYDYSSILTTLLPISIAISTSQIIRDYRQIDFGFICGIMIYTVPFIIFFLLIALNSRKELNLLIATLLCLFALKNFYHPLGNTLNRYAHYEKSWLILTGVIHGLTNLGGSLLTILVQQRGYPKDTARVTIASAYILFALFQLLTLISINEDATLSLLKNNGYVLVGVCVYLITNQLFYKRLNSKSYTTAFSGFLFCSGVLVGIKSFL